MLIAVCVFACCCCSPLMSIQPKPAIKPREEVTFL